LLERQRKIIQIPIIYDRLKLIQVSIKIWMT
jgi:hypothetical protein